MAYFKYRQVADQLLDKIKNQEYKNGERIPKEDELCTIFGVGKQTVRKAVSLLEDSGYVERIQGSGTYVRDGRETGADPAEEEPASQENSRTISRTISLVMMNNQNYIFVEVMQGISDYLLEHGYILTTVVTDGNYDKEYRALQTILNASPAGLLFEPVSSGLRSINEELYKEIAEKIPCLLLHMDPTELFPALPLLDRKGMRLATEHLISLGHRKIGGIFVFDEMTGQNRHRGYLDALRRSGISAEQENIVWVQHCHGDDLFRGDENPVLEQMIRNVTAVVCHDDRIASRLIRYLTQRGIRVPEEMSVVGYDDSEFATFELPLTTVSHPKRAYGRKAAEVLLNMIESDHTVYPENYTIDPELIIRESTAPPASFGENES